MNGPSWGWLDGASGLISQLPPQQTAAPMQSVAPMQSSAPPELPPAGPPLPPMELPQELPPAPAAPQPGLPPAGPPPPPPVAPVALSPPAPEAAPAPDVQFAQVGGGGVTPAREVSIRGPKQAALLERSFEHPLSAADRVEERSAIQAQREAALYEQQAEDWHNRQGAMERVAARREQEMAGMRQQYADTIQQIGSQKIDTDRLWANSSTGEKIGAIALGFIGGIFSQGTENKIQKALDKRMEDDVKAQQFDYRKGLDIAKAQETAYGMAMSQFGSEDAAYHAALGAAQQYTSAKMGALAAEWKGTESANRADEMRAHYQEQADVSKANGLKFLQPTASAPQFALSVRGQRAPGLFSQDKAQAAFFEHGIKPSERVDEKVVEGGIQSTLQRQKSAQDLAKDAAKTAKTHDVVLPNGETVSAPSEPEAKTLRDLVTATNNTKRLVAEARTIRNDSAFRVSPSSRARLGQIQAELLTDFGVQHQLGALSDADYKIAQEGTADLFNLGGAVEARLDRLQETAVNKVHSRVATIPGASAKAQGVMPKSTTEGWGAK